MLIKSKRTLDSFLNAISRHITAEGDWELEDDKEYQIVFGSGEWLGIPTFDEDHHDLVHGIELFNEGYKEAELLLVEKAIGLLEGITFSGNLDAIASDDKPLRRGKRRKMKVVEDEIDGESTEE